MSTDCAKWANCSCSSCGCGDSCECGTVPRAIVDELKRRTCGFSDCKCGVSCKCGEACASGDRGASCKCSASVPRTETEWIALGKEAMDQAAASKPVQEPASVPPKPDQNPKVA